MERVTSNGGLDFGGKLDHDANMGIFKGIYTNAG